jgi:hypothetical protein
MKNKYMSVMQEIMSKEYSLSENLFALIRSIWTNDINIKDYRIEIKDDRVTILIEMD